MHPLSATMSFGDHLEDLRRRLVLALLIPVPIFIVSLVFGGHLLAFLVEPVREALARAGQPEQLIATGVVETFAAYIKVSFVVTLGIAMPWVLYQLWLFIAPGLYANERRFVYFFIPLSALLTALGAAFLYFILLPISLFFLIQFGANIVEQSPGVASVPEGMVFPQWPVLDGDPPRAALTPGSYWYNQQLAQLRFFDGTTVRGASLHTGGLIAQQYRIKEYISLVLTLAVVFMLAFQLPVVMMLFGWTGIIDRNWLGRYRKHIAFACAIAGAILTPQDPLSMILLGGALYALFELGLVLMRFITPAVVAGNAEGRNTDADKEPPEGS